MKYIDAEKLIAKIVELRKELPDTIEHLNDEERGFARGQQYELTAIESEILCLQQEQAEVGLEKELNEWMKYGPHTCYPWCTIPDAIKITAEHFYELGLNARKK